MELTTHQFERGEVNYMISASVTRPTTIMPVTNRVCKLMFRDRIDIESMYTPKSRAIYLEPMIRRGKVKRVKQASSIETQGTPTTRSLSRQNTVTSVQTRSTAPLQESPSSPAPSEDAVVTHATSSTHSLNLPDNQSSQRQESPDSSEPRSSTTSNSAHTISATTEILRHGALAGEPVSISVKVEHTKAARGFVIATLFRQSRVDMHPPLPIATRSKKKKPEYEDVYPKSRTGLGGLYFTDGTPNRAFRMDLSQTYTMMVVDPDTKTADVKFSIKVPKEAFPTMNNIPGGMISFTYCIEVVVDLTGKLGDKLGPPGFFSLVTNGPSFTQSNETRHELTSEWTNNILDTAPLRRTRNVASFELPLIIGTEDSSRHRRIQDPNSGSRSVEDYHHQESHDMYAPSSNGRSWHGRNHDGYEQEDNHYDHEGHNDGWYDENGNPLYDSWQGAPYHHRPGQDGHYDASLPQSEAQQDEMSRLARHEEFLLSSVPSGSEASSSGAHRLAPSAPTLDGDSVHHSRSPGPPVSITVSRASARSAETIVPDPLTPPPSLPDDEAPDPLEDKQELERRRLLAQASAPPTDDDHEGRPSNMQAYAAQAPSAPVIHEDEEYILQALRQDTNESLPQYRR